MRITPNLRRLRTRRSVWDIPHSCIKAGRLRDDRSHKDMTFVDIPEDGRTATVRRDAVMQTGLKDMLRRPNH